jgi:hypothetical protein
MKVGTQKIHSEFCMERFCKTAFKRPRDGCEDYMKMEKYLVKMEGRGIWFRWSDYRFLY